MIPEEDKTKTQLEVQLAELDAFLASGYYRSFQFTLNQDVKVLEQQLLELRPSNPEAVSALCELHGNRDTLSSFLTFFEESRQTLKTNLSNVAEAAQELTKSKQ